MKILAQHMQDGEAEGDAAGMIERMENNFERLLFDHEKGWFYTSADSQTLEPRKVYCACLLYTSEPGDDLPGR